MTKQLEQQQHQLQQQQQQQQQQSNASGAGLGLASGKQNENNNAGQANARTNGQPPLRPMNTATDWKASSDKKKSSSCCCCPWFSWITSAFRSGGDSPGTPRSPSERNFWRIDTPAELTELLCDGRAIFDPAFKVPLDVDDLHPCPPPAPEFLNIKIAPLPAQTLPSQLETLLTYLNKSEATAPKDTQLALLPNMKIGQDFGEFRFIELFAGIGGFRLGMEALGGKCVFSSELHPTAQAVYCDHWMGAKEAGIMAGDIRLIPGEEVPDHELLTAGFPCQPFSALGEQEGMLESKGRLFLQICRVLRAKRPPLALLENVPGLIRALETVLEEVRLSGYRVAHRIYNSASLLPQKRKRLFIVAIRSDLSEVCEAYRFPWLPELKRSLGEIVQTRLSKPELDSLVPTSERLFRLRESKAFKESPEDVIAKLSGPAAPLVSSYGQGGSGQFVRYTQLVPGGEEEDASPRRYSSRECARLQGFPESFSYQACEGPRAWYRLIGNAVSPPVVCALGASLLSAYKHADKKCPCPGLAAALQLAVDATPEPARSRLLNRPIDPFNDRVCDIIAAASGAAGSSNESFYSCSDNPKGLSAE
eukprot:CAMPEP_0206476802 /NCGR_PEP_ID=MMETSP0324_2-20121206/34953_1 /ASSEMBLY_ACC=CAM_ASM_000836 /TAXON_ID=2866 /ORGANISM="Crypthecodinium cohnii, Strain Seligo" /LENGTH=590 /DNA_ID=CAMNT_0053952543 /DNA_START=48 /DNA_END=1821 /DNA_ORIENTATION=-